jgi:maleate isomerase
MNGLKLMHQKNQIQIFFGGNGLRTVGTIAALEKYLRKPVISPNQVLLWAALRSAGIKSTIKNYGKIFNA